jgi:cytidylate kinase
MQTDGAGIQAMRAVTISREYGSGGGEIARQLAERLGWRLIDHEVVVRVASELGISPDEAEEFDEHTKSGIDALLGSLQVLDSTSAVSPPPPALMDARTYAEALREVVLSVAQAGHVIIVGRGSQVILANRGDTLHVRVVAPLEPRITYVMRREQLSHDDARSRIVQKDRDRARAVQLQQRQNLEDMRLYDLIVNTGVIELAGAVDLIMLALERKAHVLGCPADELGPGAHMRPYSTQPADLPPPAGSQEA